LARGARQSVVHSGKGRGMHTAFTTRMTQPSPWFHGQVLDYIAFRADGTFFAMLASMRD
jgi:hypothetical protein